MKNIILLSAVLFTAVLSVNVQARPVTIKMQACDQKDNRTISSNCKNRAAGFTLRYTMTEYGDYGSMLTIYNPSTRAINLDLIEFYNGFNERCELDSWGPHGTTIRSKSTYQIMTSECKPERILKYVFIAGNKRYVF